MTRSAPCAVRATCSASAFQAERLGPGRRGVNARMREGRPSGAHGRVARARRGYVTTPLTGNTARVSPCCRSRRLAGPGKAPASCELAALVDSTGADHRSAGCTGDEVLLLVAFRMLVAAVRADAGSPHRPCAVPPADAAPRLSSQALLGGVSVAWPRRRVGPAWPRSAAGRDEPLSLPRRRPAKLQSRARTTLVSRRKNR